MYIGMVLNNVSMVWSAYHCVHGTSCLCALSAMQCIHTLSHPNISNISFRSLFIEIYRVSTWACIQCHNSLPKDFEMITAATVWKLAWSCLTQSHVHVHEMLKSMHAWPHCTSLNIIYSCHNINSVETYVLLLCGLKCTSFVTLGQVSHMYCQCLNSTQMCARQTLTCVFQTSFHTRVAAQLLIQYWSLVQIAYDNYVLWLGFNFITKSIIDAKKHNIFLALSITQLILLFHPKYLCSNIVVDSYWSRCVVQRRETQGFHIREEHTMIQLNNSCLVNMTNYLIYAFECVISTILRYAA